MTGRGGSVLGVLLAGLVASPASSSPVAATPAVTRIDLGSAAILEAVLPGRVTGYAAACETETDCHGLLLLVRTVGRGAAPTEPDEEARPPRLLRFDITLALSAEDPAAALSEATPWVPHDADELALIDLDGDGDAELAAGEPGRLWSYGPPAALEPPLPVLAGPGVDLAASRGLIHPRLARFPVAEVGRLRWFAPAGGGLEAFGSTTLPISARRRSGGLELTSPEPMPMPGLDGAAPSWVAGPEAHGDRRLRSVLIDPSTADGAVAEAWTLLPGAERVAAARYERIDGRPALIVFTHGADKLRLFDQKRLRVFLLSSDRTRAGSTPVLAADTRSHLWQSAEASVADFDGDGHDDVAVVQVKGMFDGEALEVDTYRGLGGGRFEGKPRQVRLKMEAPDWRWSDDLDGDGLPDLIATSGDRLSVFTAAGRRRGNALGEKPAWQLTLPGEPEPEAEVETGEDEEVEVEVEVRGDGEGAELHARHESLLSLDDVPRALDLDGDGRDELVSVGGLPDGRQRLRVIVLRPPS